MKERIKILRKNLNLTQQSFADRLGLKRQTIASYEIGNIEPSESTLLLMCREFDVNEEWLRTGDGKMFKSIDDKFSTYLGKIAKGEDAFIQDIIETYMELDQVSKDALKKLAAGMIDKHNKREQN